MAEVVQFIVRTVIGIVAPPVMAVLYLLTILFPPPFEKTITVFPDGSELTIAGDGFSCACAHRLFGNLAIVSGAEEDDRIETVADAEWYSGANEDQKEYSAASSFAAGDFLRYAFSPAGYIVYETLSQTDETDEAAVRTYCVYSAEKGAAPAFASYAETQAYLKTQGIEVGAWYYPLFLDTGAEYRAASAGDWRLFALPNGLSLVRRGNEELFAGEIDRYACTAQALAFHIRIDGDISDRLEGFENPVLPHSSADGVVKRTFFLGTEVYTDRYVVCTADGDFRLFDTKKEAAAAMALTGETVRWKKVKYEKSAETVGTEVFREKQKKAGKDKAS